LQIFEVSFECWKEGRAPIVQKVATVASKEEWSEPLDLSYRVSHMNRVIAKADLGSHHFFEVY